MKDENKTKEQLQDELIKLRQRVAELEKSETQYKQTVEVLRESESLYRSFIESAKNIIFTISSDSTITSLSPAFETITGWERAQWLGKNFQSLIHPDDISFPLEIYQHIFNREMLPPSFELRILSKSGDYIAMEFTIIPQIRDGRVISYLGAGCDTTKRKHAEEVSQQCEEKYSMLISNMREGVFLIQDDKIQFVNEAFIRMFGCTLEGAVGKDFREFVAPEDFELVMDRYYQRQAGKDIPEEYEFHAQHRDGTKLAVDINIGFITHRGRIATIGVVKDITELKRVEEALQECEEKYSILVEHSNDIIRLLEKSLSDK